MNTAPLMSSTLNNWDGHSKKGQAAYDRHFNWEQQMADAQDIIANQIDYTDEEVDAAYALIAKYK